MTDAPEFPHTSGIHPEVLDFQWKHFALGSDLRHLAGVWEACAPEATVFYAARILEALTAAGIDRFEMEPSSNVWSNLKLLQQFGMLDVSAMYWTHALRRVGNQARHIHRSLGLEDAELSLVLADRALVWFFCRFPGGPRLESMTDDGGSATPEGDADFRHLLRQIDEGAEELDPSSLDDAVLVRTAEMPGVVAEILIEAKRRDEAAVLLLRALEIFPDVPRLRQLMGLLHSRAGRLEDALDWLVPLAKSGGGDEETLGILAAVRKHRWKANRERNVDELKRSHRGYAKGWKISGRANTWLGINAAATALWLGDKRRCREIARTVLVLFESRLAALDAHVGDARARMDYWDQVTVAEAALLLEDLDRAERLYAEAFRRFACKEKASSIETTKRQARETLVHLGRRDELADLLRPVDG